MRKIVWLAALILGACAPPLAPSDTRWDEFSYLPSFPRDQETVWSNDAQGVAHDASSWYLSDSWAIYKYPVGADPGGDGYVASVGLAPDCEHIGDIDHHAGRVYAPLEQCGGAAPNRVYVHDARTLAVVTWGVVPQSSAPWVAVSPVDGAIYSSESDTRVVNVYAPGFATGETLRLLGRIDLGRLHHRIQGGAFSADGRMYLVSDDAERPERAGILAFDLDDTVATRVGRIAPAAGYPEDGAEMEGITVWDLDRVPGRHPSVGGQIHWVNLDNDGPFDSDNVSLEHIRAGVGQ